METETNRRKERTRRKRNKKAGTAKAVPFFLLSIYIVCLT
nr:MAG TPA: hypothetical protein [Caudoviricetes sp.]